MGPAGAEGDAATASLRSVVTRRSAEGTRVKTRGGGEETLGREAIFHSAVRRGSIKGRKAEGCDGVARLRCRTT